MLCPASHYLVKKLRSVSLRLAAGLLLVVATSAGAIASPRVARLISLRTENGAADRIESATLARASALRLRLLLPGTGVTSIEVRRPPHSRGSLPLMQGHSLSPARGKSRSTRFARRWAAASFADGKHFTLNFATSGPRGATIFFALTADENAKVFRIVRAPHYALANKGCLSSHPIAESGTPLSLPLTSQLNLAKNLSISTVADHLWSSRYGSSANSRIQTITNSASAIYGRDLGMRISIADQKIDTSPFSYPSSITASEEFLSRVSAQESLRGANETVMFTARDFDSGVIGIAYLGTVCIDPSASYASIQRFQDALDPVILAHEIGHTLSAEHDASGIMTTALNPSSPPSSFSATSIGQISSHVRTYGSCLAPILATPTKTPTPTPTSTTSGSGSSTSLSKQARLRFSTNRNRIILRLSLPNQPSTCTFSLKAGTSDRTLFTNGVLLRSSTVQDTPKNLSASLRRRTRVSTKIFVRGYTKCPGSSSIKTNLIWFDAATIPVARSASATTFIRDLKLLLREG